MGFFGGKKDKGKDEEKKKGKQALPIEMRKRVYLPGSRSYGLVRGAGEGKSRGRRRRVRMPDPRSREFKLFKHGDERKLSWYERLVGIASRILQMKADPKMRDDLSKAIAFTGLRVTPDGVMSLFVLTVLGFVMAGVVYALQALMTGGGMLQMGLGMMIAAGGFLVGYYFLKYPINKVKTMRIKASSQVVLAVLYMVISMRVSPNLERALAFAATNVSGELAWDMRRVLWDIEMRKYYSASDALDDYIVKWKSENEEFAEALRLIKDSRNHPPERSKEVLDNALEVILEGTKTRMKHYAQDLRMPVMIIHMMGIVLPILGTIMAPLAAVFMSDIVGPIHFIIGYDIVLPIAILFLIQNTLSKRPMTFSQIDLSVYPDLPRKGSVRIGKADIPMAPLAAFFILVMAIFPVYYFATNPGLLMTGTNEFGAHGSFELVMSMLIVLGVALGLSGYFMLTNYQRVQIQQKIQKTEGEFEIAMFQLGNRISGGTPTELAVEKSIGDMKDLEIAGLFRLTLRNIRNLGMTFEDALFNKKWGALLYYPSRLIRNVMLAVTDTARTGVRYAAESMLRISRYLKNIRETQEYIRDMLSETASSMKFQAYFLTPMITGLIVSMTSVIVLVLGQLGCYLKGMELSSTMGIGDFASAFNMEANTSPEVFQLIVGIYLIQVVIILGIFLTKIGEGDNSTSQWYNVGKMLLIAIVVYFIVALVANEVFAELINSALSDLVGSSSC